MRWRLELSIEAIGDLREIREWLTQPGAGRIARDRLAGLRQAIDGLAEHPMRYPRNEQFGLREMPTDRYRVVYSVVDPTVTVVRVFGPGQRRQRR